MYVANSTGGLMLQTMLYLANHTNRAAMDTLIDLPPSTKADVNEVKCYGVYGCFPLNGPWHTKTRPINAHPQKPSQIEPHFTLYTTRAFDDPKYIDLNDPEAIRYMGINPNGKLYIIAHGYLEAGDIPWMIEMGKTLLQHEPEGQAAVVLIDWGGGSSPPYIQAVANIRLVGAIAAHVIHMIYEELGMDNLHKVHFIGHSLGSHLAGYAGTHLQKDFGLKLARITGLDPAAPLFGETDHIVRLDRSDAHFVDVIHTDAYVVAGLGLYQRIGHLDFYPNGGISMPGCDMKLQDYMRNRDNTLFQNMQEYLGCNHLRSYQYFTESIGSKCPFMGITCDSFESFKEGKCSRCNENDKHCFRMGFHSYEDYRPMVKARKLDLKKPPVLYLMTSDKAPFCRNHYKITVRVSGHDQSTTHGGEIGTLSLRLHSKSKKHETETMQFSPEPKFFEPGYEYSSMVVGHHIKDPVYASVFWEYQTSLFNPLTWRLLTSPRIFISYIIIESLESPHVYLKLCPINESSAVIAGSENIMQEQYCQHASSSHTPKTIK
ncbi:pancreatic triacylglycerol lipase [Stomoxys calcitrans]|uniref:pancreatic triacylglycerol lipase n=1 Tax=Stomoxys calcitrans TaxID=35570 RepID=UPI0027E29745|nr:pancreatic triacylglycerol lipase [Stomoxys calcitrans]